MPKYSFDCKVCNNFFSMLIPFEDLELAECPKCSSNDVFRVFDFAGHKVERTNLERLEGIKKEAKIIAQKVKSGDQNAISEIYGGSK